MRARLLELALILTAGAGVGLTVNFAHPRGISLGEQVFSAAESGSGSCDTGPQAVAPIDSQAAATLCGSCDVAFVDARGAAFFAQGHIPSAVHLPPAEQDHADSVIGTLFEKSTVIVYGDNTECDQALSIAHRLTASGLSDVRILEGGWPTWVATDQPSVSGICEQCSHEAAHE